MSKATVKFNKNELSLILESLAVYEQKTLERMVTANDDDYDCYYEVVDFINKLQQKIDK